MGARARARERERERERERVVEFRENIPTQVAAGGDATFRLARVFRMQP